MVFLEKGETRPVGRVEYVYPDEKASPAGVVQLRCLPTSFVISNIDT
jgi:hypothetical protein